MPQKIEGGVVMTASEQQAIEYLPNKGVFLAQVLGQARGQDFGLYRGKIEPGFEISTEIHPGTSETLYILSGQAVGTIGDREIPLRAGQVMHVHKNVHHGLRNVGSAPLEFLVIASPDF